MAVNNADVAQYDPKLALQRAELVLQISTTLSQADNETSILAALSGFAAEQNATAVALSYIDIVENGSLFEKTKVAHWQNADTTFDLAGFSLYDVWLQSAGEVVFVEDGTTDSRINDAARALMLEHQTHAAVVIPLQRAGQWLGVIYILWAEPHAFAVEEVYIYNGLLQAITSAVANRRAYLTLEDTRWRSEIIAQMNASLGQATDEQQILDAIAVMVERYDVGLSTLNYVHLNAAGVPDIIETMAIQNKGFPVPLSVLPQTRYPTDAFPIQNIIFADAQPLFMEDVLTDPRTEVGVTRELMKASASLAVIVLPLRSGDRWQGTFTFSWPEKQIFPAELREILIAITPTAAAVVANRRLLKQAELLYKTSEERLRVVVNNAPLMMHALNQDGTFILSEGKGLQDFGLKPGELVGQSVFDVYEDYSDLLQHNRRALTGESFTATTEIRERTYQIWYSPAVDEMGQAGGIISVAIDVTDRKRAEVERERLIRQLREASRFKDEFFAVMSHELRTPLNAMIGLLGIALMGGNLDEQNSMLVTRARANSERLLTLINNILDLSRMEAGRLEIVPIALSLRKMVERLRQNTSVLAEQKGIELSTSVEADVPEVVMMDEDALDKIMTNLVANAVKFTEEGTVSLTISRLNENLILKVQDTGIGIPAHMQDVIFESFRQVDASSTRAHGGSGLGLSIVHNLCVAMQGSIRVESKPGVGSTFTVTLPIHVEKVLKQD